MLLQQSSQQSRCLLLPSCEGKSQISKTVATSIKSSANSPASSSVGLPIDSAATPTLVKSRKRPGTRITGVGSQSFRNRSVFANEGNSRVSTKATFSALSGDMQHNSENQSAQASGSSELDGNARSFHVKLSEDALYFSQDNCSNRVVGLTVRKEVGPDGQMLEAKFCGESVLKDTRRSRLRALREANGKSSSSTAKWIPIEGLYGIYNLPSGPHAVLITESEEAYRSPPARSGQANAAINTTSPPLLHLRRIISMEIVRVPRKRGSKAPDMSALQRKSEERQLRLLRRSFREHDLYFVPSYHGFGGNATICVKDITQTLQRSFLDTKENRKQSLSQWWHPQIAGDVKVEGDTQLARPDPRFFWNEVHLEPLLKAARENGRGSVDRAECPFSTLLNLTFPVTSAFLGIQSRVPISAGRKGEKSIVTYDEILISRRSKYRAGTRFTRRGADGTGAVTNYAESEQICLLIEGFGDDERLSEAYSHVQTRGSIPIRWSSPADVKTYAPRVLIGTDPIAQGRALRNHLVEQIRLYTVDRFRILTLSNPSRSTKKQPVKLSFINLIDKKSDQGRLGRAFDSVLSAVLDIYSNDSNMDAKATHSHLIPPDSVQHVWFDFHAECKGGRWDRLENLLHDVTPLLEDHGYFSAAPNSNFTEKWKIHSVQDGVIRTNCMDCLDRTNVVQSIFGRYVLFNQLRERLAYNSSRKRSLPLEYNSSYKRNQMKLPWSRGEVSHRLLWADNADAISRLYAGTPALKGDFTRTGKRTKRGALDDGINSLQRYYLNNFIDADRQEGMDLLSGHEGFFIVVDDDDNGGGEELSGLLKSPSIGQEQGAESGDILRNIFMRGSNFQPLKTGTPTGRPQVKALDLDLNWLPGDLKSHMRSSAASIGEKEIKSELLKSIDRRSASDLPWWIFDETESEEEELS